MDTLAVVLEEPERLSLRRLDLQDAAADDLVIKIDWSGISTGTERLLWSGRMPPFPGMGYPLVPGYESVGRVIDAGSGVRDRIGERVFVPGSSGFKDARGLFGGAARRVVAPSARVVSISESLAEQGVLIALAATARHAIARGPGCAGPDRRPRGARATSGPNRHRRRSRRADGLGHQPRAARRR